MSSTPDQRAAAPRYGQPGADPHYVRRGSTPKELDNCTSFRRAVELPFSPKKPVIRIREIFDEKSSKHKLEKVRYWDQVEIPYLDDNQYIMSSLLDEDRGIYAKRAAPTQMPQNEMIEILTDEGQIDGGSFGERLFEA